MVYSVRKGKIKSSKSIEEIFNFGKVFHSAGRKIKAHFIVKRSNSISGIKSTVAVPKKSGKAVWRNRIKRLINEAFRKYSKELSEYCFKNNIIIEVIFVPGTLNEKSAERIFLNYIAPSVNELLNRIKSELSGLNFQNGRTII